MVNRNRPIDIMAESRAHQQSHDGLVPREKGGRQGAFQQKDEHDGAPKASAVGNMSRTSRNDALRNLGG